MCENMVENMRENMRENICEIMYENICDNMCDLFVNISWDCIKLCGDVWHGLGMGLEECGRCC